MNALKIMVNKLLVCTPYARVPCHALPYYLTETEFNNIPIGSEG